MFHSIDINPSKYQTTFATRYKSLKNVHYRRWRPRKKRTMGTWSHNRLCLEWAVPNFKEASKHDVLSNLGAKLNSKCRMNYS